MINTLLTVVNKAISQPPMPPALGRYPDPLQMINGHPDEPKRLE